MEDMNFIKNNNIYRYICIFLISIMFIGIVVGMYESVMFYTDGQNGTTSFDKIVDIWNNFNSK